MSYVGIDYGRGITNRSPEGISYGIISLNAVPSSVWDLIDAQYSPYCPW